jgi:hypothetical protein
MNNSLPVMAALLGGCALAACSQQDAASAAAPATSTETASPTDDPCKLVTDKDVRNAFGDTASGKRDHSLDKYGIATCTWDTTHNTFVVQMFKAKGSVADELRSRISGSVDPLKPGAADRLNYQTLAGLGDETMLVAEKADAEQGVLADTAVLVTRHGERMAVLFTNPLVKGERAATVSVLEALGRSAASRL